MDDRQIFTVTDLKQFTYCRRVVYYTYCLPLIRPKTYKMSAGVAAHERAARLEQRRTLKAYRLAEGTRHFDVSAESVELGLRGRVDLVIRTASETGPELVVVDYKNSRRRIGRHVKLQLSAYALMLEESWEMPAGRGFVVSLLSRQSEEVRLTARLRQEVREAVDAMRQMVDREAMPDPPRTRKPCVGCEFRRFCNDVL